MWLNLLHFGETHPISPKWVGFGEMGAFGTPNPPPGGPSGPGHGDPGPGHGKSMPGLGFSMPGGRKGTHFTKFHHLGSKSQIFLKMGEFHLKRRNLAKPQHVSLK